VSYNTKERLVLENSAQIPLLLPWSQRSTEQKQGFSFVKDKKVRLRDDDARVSGV
jgi:hypothetical protein